MTKKTTLIGLPVKDAKNAIRLEILSSDIKSGQRKDNAHCAAANACLGVLVEIENAFTGRERKDAVNLHLHVDGLRTLLPRRLNTLWGLSALAENKLINANDTLDWTFDQIAAAIEVGNILGEEI